MKFRTRETPEVNEPEVREPESRPPVGQWTTTVTRTAALKLSNGRVIGVEKIESVLPITDPDTGESLGCIIGMASGAEYTVGNSADEVLDSWLGRKTTPSH